jgi:hypothetical protein
LRGGIRCPRRIPPGQDHLRATFDQRRAHCMPEPTRPPGDEHTDIRHVAHEHDAKTWSALQVKDRAPARHWGSLGE